MRRAVSVLSMTLALCAPARAQEARPGPTLAFGGDVLYEAPLAYQIDRRAEEVGLERAMREVFVDLAPALRGADLAIVNLESPVSTRYRERDGGGAVFAAPDALLDALAHAGVDAVSVANNHAFDQGLEGLRNTLDAATRRGVVPLGAGDDAAAAARAVRLEAGGARIAVTAWTEGTNHRPRRDERLSPWIAFFLEGDVAASVAEARREAQLVVAMFHWTHGDVARPRDLMREAAIGAAEAGADLVVGHGTHVPGNTEVLTTSDGRRVPVLYSLGNLVAAMNEPAGSLDSREVGVCDAPLAIVRTRWVGERLEVGGVELLHYWIARPEGQAPWVEGGRLPVLRTVRIEEELRRLEAAGCGWDCDERAAHYRRRVELIDAAMARIDDSRDERIAIRPAFVGHPGPSATSGPTLAATTREAVATAGAARGEALSIEFAEHAVRESAVDAAAIARMAERMLVDRGLRVEIVAHPTAAEVARRASIGRLRARRVMGLIAIRGPSRARFETRAGAPAERARVVLRVHR